MKGLRHLLSFLWRGSDPAPSPKLVRVKIARYRCFVCCQPIEDGAEAVSFDDHLSHISCSIHHRFVAFWDESAWVVGASAYNCVVQGPTLEEAVERLARTLRSETILARERGSLKPYYIDGPGKEPDPKYLTIEGDIEFDPDVEPNQDHRYTGWVRVPSIKEMLS